MSKNTLSSGRPTNKEKAIEAVQEIEEIQEATQRLNVELPASLKRDFKIQAARDGLKLNELTIKLINEYLSRNSNEQMSK